MFRHFLFLPLFAIFAACGPSAATDNAPPGGNTPTSPATPASPPTGLRDFTVPVAPADATAETGYASGSGLYLNVAYDAKPQYMNVTGANGPTLDTATAIFKPTTSGAILTLNGTDFTLGTTTGNGNFNYSYAQNGTTVKVEIYTTGTEVFLAYASHHDGTSLTDGFAPIGANTAPANIPTSGSAGYAGVFAGYANYADGSFDPLDGTMAFTVNFDAATITGGGTLSNAGNSDVYGTVSLGSVDIVGNTFATQPTVTFTDPNQIAQDTVLSGDFYGPSGTEIAGTLAVEATNPTGAVTVQGAFHAD